MVTKRKNPNRLKDKELISLYAEKTQAAALRELSERTRVPQQAYLREGLDWILKRYETAEIVERTRKSLKV